MTDCIAGINVHLEHQTLSLYDQLIQERSLQCGSQCVIQMIDRSSLYMYDILPPTFKYLSLRHVLHSSAKYAHIRRKYFAFNPLFELFRDTPAGFIIQFLRECNLYYMF